MNAAIASQADSARAPSLPTRPYAYANPSANRPPSAAPSITTPVNKPRPACVFRLTSSAPGASPLFAWAVSSNAMALVSGGAPAIFAKPNVSGPAATPASIPRNSSLPIMIHSQSVAREPKQMAAIVDELMQVHASDACCRALFSTDEVQGKQQY